MYSDELIPSEIVQKARAVRSAHRLNPHWKEVTPQYRGSNETPQYRGPNPDLSAREIDVLRGIAEGMTNVEIGHALEISKETVMAHVKRILAKMSAKNRAHVVAIGFIKGILEVEDA